MGNKSGCSNTEQSSEVVVSDREPRLLSGMSRNQSRSVQSNLWQETTSLWDTPAVHLYAAQHHKQLNSGGLELLQLSGEKYVSIFPLSVAEKTIQIRLYFPHYCSLVWISLLPLLLLSVFPQYTHSRGPLVTASHYSSETAALAGSPVIPLRLPHCQDEQCARQTGFRGRHGLLKTPKAHVSGVSE